jgi:tetratricopeptide (TPR) repeat protein
VNAKKLSIVNYAAAAVIAVLSVFLAYKAYTSWRFYSNAEHAVVLYDSGQLGAAQEALSSYTKPYAPGDAEIAILDAHALSLQGYHGRAVRALKESGLQEEENVKLAIAVETMYLPADSVKETAARIPLLEEAARACPAPEGLVSLCGAYATAGQLEEAAASLKAAADDRGKLSLDGLAAFYVNAGITLYRQKKHREAAEMFKQVLDLLPDRKLPPLSGEREGARTCAQSGIVLACANWLTDSGEDDDSRSEAVKYVVGVLEETQFSASGPKERWDLGAGRFALLNALGIAQGRLGEHDTALKSLSAALKATRAVEKEKRSQVKQRISLNRLILTARKHDAAKPKSVSKYEYRKLGKELAAAGAQKGLSKSLRYAAYNLSARCYAGGGREKEARESLAAAIELAPEYPLAHVNLAVVYDSEGNKAEALKEYEAALKLEGVERRDEIIRRVAKLRE